MWYGSGGLRPAIIFRDDQVVFVDWAHVDRYTTQGIAAIVEDTLSGAAELAEKSAAVLARIADTSQQNDPAQLRADILQAGRALIRAHPTMAPLVNLINLVLQRVDTAKGAPAAAVLASTSEFTRRLRTHESAIAEAALSLIPDQAVILTNGRSTTVRAALYYAQRARRRFQVVCAEGRPGCEGRVLAGELAAVGIPVTLVVDMLAVSFTREVQLVMVGADHIGQHGLVNKVGTYAIALAAQAAKTPMYALCGSEKFLPPEYRPARQAEWPAEQVWSAAPNGVQIINRYYDATPTDLLAGIVNERGVVPAVGIDAWMAATQVHPDLL